MKPMTRSAYHFLLRLYRMRIHEVRNFRPFHANPLSPEAAANFKARSEALNEFIIAGYRLAYRHARTHFFSPENQAQLQK